MDRASLSRKNVILIQKKIQEKISKYDSLVETIGDGEDETNILVVYNQREENVEVDKSEAGCVGDVDDDAQPRKEGRDGGKGRS